MPSFEADMAIDDDDATPWIAERIMGTPGDVSEGSFDVNWYGKFFVSQANLTVPTGLGKGYRWLRIQASFGDKIWDGYLCNKNGVLGHYLNINGKADYRSRIFICENLSLFKAYNPVTDPTRILEVGSAFFDAIDLASDALALWGGPMGGSIGWQGNAIKWGNDVNVEARRDSKNATSMSGPCIPAPAMGQIIRYRRFANATQPVNNFIVDYCDPAGYEPGDTHVNPWFLMLLPGMGLKLKADITNSATGVIELWDGKTTQTNGLPTSGTIQIGMEQITYNAKSATTITLLARGAGGTTAAVHKANDPVYLVDGGRATDAHAIKTLSWKRRSGGAYPVNFKVYGSHMTVQPRYPVADDENPNHEYPNDYELLANVTGHAASTWSLDLSSAPKRVSWILFECSKMSSDPCRVRLDTLSAVMDSSLLDQSCILPDYATLDACFIRLLTNAGIPIGGITINLPMPTSSPFELGTAKGLAWQILADLADYTSSFIEITPLSQIVIRTNALWRTDQSQSPAYLWDRNNAASIRFLGERSNPIGQIQMKWMLPNGDEGGTQVYPATIDPIGDMVEMKESMYPDAAKALAAMERRYVLAKYPYTLGVEAALGQDAVEIGDVHSLAWDFTDGTATRTGFVRDVEDTIEALTWKTAVRLIVIREAY
jgi:hypothetical protein